MSNDELIARAEVALDGVTDGPWRYRPTKYCDWGTVGTGDFMICQARDPSKLDDDILDDHRKRGADPWEENARFIAAARDLVPDLIAALKASEARVKVLEEALVKSRRIMANRQPDKMPDGVHICDEALKGGAE